jgi:transcriptional regulator with XRE-family HTH domain
MTESGVADRASSTVRRRELGHRLRELRQGLDLTLDQVAAELMCSSTKISRIESGARRASLRDVRDLCAVYHVPDAERDRMMELARESRSPGWWEDFDLPYLTYIGLEQSAVGISEYSANIIPGLMQTTEYSIALAAGMEPKLNAEVHRERAEVKQTRQQILHGNGAPQLWAIVEDAALTRVVGSHETMSAQLAALLEAVRLPNVDLQVVPLDVGAHPALNSNFIILDLGTHGVPDVVYVEGLLGFIYLERAADIQRYRRAFDQLRAAALSPHLSMRRIAEVKRYHDEKSTVRNT